MTSPGMAQNPIVKSSSIFLLVILMEVELSAGRNASQQLLNISESWANYSVAYNSTETTSAVAQASITTTPVPDNTSTALPVLITTTPISDNTSSSPPVPITTTPIPDNTSSTLPVLITTTPIPDNTSSTPPVSITTTPVPDNTSTALPVLITTTPIPDNTSSTLPVLITTTPIPDNTNSTLSVLITTTPVPNHTSSTPPVAITTTPVPNHTSSTPPNQQVVPTSTPIPSSTNIPAVSTTPQPNTAQINPPSLSEDHKFTAVFQFAYSLSEFQGIQSLFKKALSSFLKTPTGYIEIISVQESSLRRQASNVNVVTKIAMDNVDTTHKTSNLLSKKTTVTELNVHFQEHGIKQIKSLTVQTKNTVAVQGKKQTPAPTQQEVQVAAAKDNRKINFRIIVIVLGCISAWTLLSSGIIIFVRRFKKRQQAQSASSPVDLERIQIELAENTQSTRESESVLYDVDLNNSAITESASNRAFEPDVSLHRRNSRKLHVSV